MRSNSSIKINYASPKVFIRESNQSHQPTPPYSYLIHPTSCGPGLLEFELSRYGSDLKGLVLVEHLFLSEDPSQLLNRSCGMSRKSLKIEYSAPTIGTVMYVKLR